MKLKTPLVLLFAFLFLLPLFTGCSGNVDVDIAEGMMLDALEEVSPAFTASRAVTWDFGGQLYELYGALNNSGVGVGYFNMYALMETADMYFSELSTQGMQITLQAVDLPAGFSTGISAENAQYDIYHDYNGSLNNEEKFSKTFGRVDGDKYSLLVVARNENGTEDSNSVIQGNYDAITGDIDIAMIYINKVNGTFEKIRARVTGNTLTHQFTLKLIRGANYSNNIIGYGISQGTGKFLLQMSQNSTSITGAKYYAFSADNLTAAALQAMDDAGSDTDTLNTGYTDELAAITAFTVADIPTDIQADINIYTSVTY